MKRRGGGSSLRGIPPSLMSSTKRTLLRRPLLSICIPTYQRAENIRVQIRSVARLLSSYSGLDFEIVVSDNHSTDGTAYVCEIATRSSSSLRYVRPKEHYPTAEQNLLFGLSNCRGEYVWVLGDDDDVVEAGVDRLVDYVCENRVDMVVFNSQSHTYGGLRLRLSRIPSQGDWRGDLRNYVQMTGFWFVLAGFSTLLLRRPQEHLNKFQGYLAVSKIYSHVTWLIEAYADRSFEFCNRPIVSYRQNYTDVVPNDHWQKVAVREGTFSKGLWTNGFLRLMDRLIEAKAISPDFMRQVVDRNIEHRFLFSFEMLRHFVEQLAAHHINPEDRFNVEEVKYFRAWAAELFCDSAAILTSLKEVEDAFDGPEGVEASVLRQLWELIADRMTKPWYIQFFVERAGAFDLFSHAGQFWAIRADCHALCSAAMESLTPAPIHHVLLTAGSMTELVKAVSSESQYIDEAASSAYASSSAPVRNFESFDSMVHRLGGEIVDRTVLDALRQKAAESETFSSRVDQLQYELTLVGQQRDAAIATMQAIEQAKFWRITSPLRKVAAVLLGRA